MPTHPSEFGEVCTSLEQNRYWVCITAERKRNTPPTYKGWYSLRVRSVQTVLRAVQTVQMVQTVQISNEWVHSHHISYRRQKTDKEPFERFERFEPWAIIIKLVWSFERFERFERLTQEKCDKYNAMTSVISSLLIYLHSFDLIPYPAWRQLNPKGLTQAGIKYFQMRSQVGSHPLVPYLLHIILEAAILPSTLP